ncbi:hypothetical protein BGW42_007681, partial [Actinomortierella wolfii]
QTPATPESTTHPKTNSATEPAPQNTPSTPVTPQTEHNRTDEWHTVSSPTQATPRKTPPSSPTFGHPSNNPFNSLQEETDQGLEDIDANDLMDNLDEKEEHGQSSVSSPTPERDSQPPEDDGMELDDEDNDGVEEELAIVTSQGGSEYPAPNQEHAQQINANKRDPTNTTPLPAG